MGGPVSPCFHYASHCILCKLDCYLWRGEVARSCPGCQPWTRATGTPGATFSAAPSTSDSVLGLYQLIHRCLPALDTEGKPAAALACLPSVCTLAREARGRPGLAPDPASLHRSS